MWSPCFSRLLWRASVCASFSVSFCLVVSLACCGCVWGIQLLVVGMAGVLSVSDTFPSQRGWRSPCEAVTVLWFPVAMVNCAGVWISPTFYVFDSVAGVLSVPTAIASIPSCARIAEESRCQWWVAVVLPNLHLCVEWDFVQLPRDQNLRG